MTSFLSPMACLKMFINKPIRRRMIAKQVKCSIKIMELRGVKLRNGKREYLKRVTFRLVNLPFSSFFSVFLELIFEVPTQLLIVLSLLYGSISLIAVIGNSLVIWIVITTKQMHSVTNFYIGIFYAIFNQQNSAKLLTNSFISFIRI